MQCTIQLPDYDPAYANKLLGLLEIFGARQGDTVLFDASNPDFIPRLGIGTADTQTPRALFDLGSEQIAVDITNQTDQERRNPETYSAITIDDFTARTADVQFLRLDHVGFNLPWFDGVHPEIIKLRQKLALQCAYYRFPTGEDWDFILPATPGEIKSGAIDLNQDRHPKLEIVSFDKCSIPLIQIDCSTDRSFEQIVALFPEGIADDFLKNVWVYVENPYGLDICFVVGEHTGEDWSSFFAGHRLTLD